MGRPERPLDGTDGPIAEFAYDLRALRHKKGNPSYRELARTALFAPSVLSSAASGYRLPTLPVTLAFVTACGADRATWERRWRKVAENVGALPESREERTPAEVTAGEAEPTRPGPHPATAPTRPAQLPMGSNTFVGRRQALAGAARAIGQSGPAKVPLVISGPIGIGKTALALRLADDVSAEFPDGQLYADLSTCGLGSQSSNGIIRGFLRALGVPAAQLPDDPMQRIGLYRSLLAERRLFVLLENVRSECQIRPLLGRATHSQVVVTSRARLLGLDGMHRIDLDTLTRQESLALIGRLAGADRVQAEHDATDALAELCGDLPLAVNIIGRKIAARPEWAVAYIAGLFAHKDRLMDSFSVGDVNVRDRYVAAFQLLPPEGRQAIRELGLSESSWTTAIGLAAAMDIAVDSADELLESLVDAGLLTRAKVAGRYSISTLVGAFATSEYSGAPALPHSPPQEAPKSSALGSPLSSPQYPGVRVQAAGARRQMI